jgi:hypothetical protein
MSFTSFLGGVSAVDPADLPQPAGARPADDAGPRQALDSFADRFGSGRFDRVQGHYIRAPRADRSIPWQPVMKLADNGPQLQRKARRLDWPAPDDGFGAVWDLGRGDGVAIVALDDGTAGSFPVGYYAIRFRGEPSR